MIGDQARCAPAGVACLNHYFTLNISPFLLFLIILLLLSACSQQATLNSERIAERYGNYGVEVLRSNGDTRVSNLYSSLGEVRTTRTLAIVRFQNPVDSQLHELHQAIVDGASIGATFKSGGWQVEKETLEICLMHPPDSVSEHLADMHLGSHPELAVHRYRFRLRRGNERLQYAVITEIHHPDYLSVADLRAIFVDDSGDYVQTDEACLVRR